MLTLVLTVWVSVNVDDLKPGLECRLGVPGIEVTKKWWVYVPIDELTYDEFRKYQIAGDTEGMRKLKHAGRLLECLAGDRVKVIEARKPVDGVEVRVTSGREKNFKGFVHHSFLCK